MGQPTYDQVMAEARRRRQAAGYGVGPNTGSRPLEYFIIETVREGWTPPEPVDPDVLAFEVWFKGALSARPEFKEPYLAGARMAREQEQERAFVLDEALDKLHRYSEQEHQRAEKLIETLDKIGGARAVAAIAAYRAGRSAR
jgi:hypothetical protein